MVRRLALPLLLMLAACASKARIFRAACDAEDADACEIVAARLLLGEDGPRDEAGAASFSKRAYDLRLRACAAGDKEACHKLSARGVAVAMPLDSPRPPPRHRFGDPGAERRPPRRWNAGGERRPRPRGRRAPGAGA